MTAGSDRRTGFHAGYTRTALRHDGNVQKATKIVLKVILWAFAVTGLISLAWGALWLAAKVLLPVIGTPPPWIMIPALLYLLCFLPPVRRMNRRIVRALN